MNAVPRTARQVAFCVLEQWEDRGQLAAPELDRLFATLPNLSPVDRGLARELSFGVIRRRATLEALLRPQLKRQPQQVESPLWRLLQLGAYQLLFFSSSSQHAAVHETVELTRWLKQPRWTGFTNAVLRSLQRDLLDEFSTSPASDALLVHDHHYRQLARPHLPDPTVEPVAYVAQSGSLPHWLVQRWSQQWDFEELLRLAAWFNNPAPIWLRVNPLSGDPETIVAQLADRGLVGHLEHRPRPVVTGVFRRLVYRPGCHGRQRGRPAGPPTRPDGPRSLCSPGNKVDTPGRADAKQRACCCRGFPSPATATD